ncbi:vegetative cell wall protein gp1-like [Etheostoma cragini]|uniref:vegetative cell wall protein gp1-like n=1 Tax=Etheostoma cragini TaxID=417921 RepID=UPI00155F27E8|nr:vegetative cell wall protein gp1-like [Etheostoma cragini]
MSPCLKTTVSNNVIFYGMDQRRKGTRDFVPNPDRPSSPRPIHRRIPASASQSGVPPGTVPGSSTGKPLSLEMDQRRKWTRDFVPNPVRPSSPRPIHRRIPASASKRGFPPGTVPGSSAGKPQTLETDQRHKGTTDFVPNPDWPSSTRPIHRRIPAIPASASKRGFPPGTDPGSSAGKLQALEADQRRKWTRDFVPNPVRPSSPRPIHRRIPAAASQSGIPPGTVPGSSAGKPQALETDQRRKGTRDFVPNPVRPSSPRPIHRRIPASASKRGFPPGTDPGSSAGKPQTLETDQRRKGTRDFVPNPVWPSSPQPIHRRIPAAASQSGVPPGTVPGFSAGKPLSLLDMALNAPQPLWDSPKPQWVKNMEVCMERRKEFGGWHKSATQPAGKPDYGFTKPRQKTPYGSPHFYSFSPFPLHCCSPCGSEPDSPSGSPLGSNPGSLSVTPCGTSPGFPNGSPRGSKPGFSSESPHSFNPGSPCGPPCGSNSDSPCGSPRGSNPGVPSGPPRGSDPGFPIGSPHGSNLVSPCAPPHGSDLGSPSASPCISDSSSSRWFPSISDPDSPCGSAKGLPHGSNPVSPCASPREYEPSSPSGSPHGSLPGSTKGSLHGSDPGSPVASSELPLLWSNPELKWVKKMTLLIRRGKPFGSKSTPEPAGKSGPGSGSPPGSDSGSSSGSHCSSDTKSTLIKEKFRTSRPSDEPTKIPQTTLKRGTYSDQPQGPTSTLKAGPSRRPCAPSALMPQWRGPEPKWVKNIRGLINMRNQGRGRKRDAAGKSAGKYFCV